MKTKSFMTSTSQKFFGGSPRKGKFKIVKLSTTNARTGFNNSPTFRGLNTLEEQKSRHSKQYS